MISLKTTVRVPRIDTKGRDKLVELMRDNLDLLMSHVHQQIDLKLTKLKKWGRKPTGGLKRSFKAKTEIKTNIPELFWLRGKLFSNHPAALVLQFGSVIRAKHKLFPVPVYKTMQKLGTEGWKPARYYKKTYGTWVHGGTIFFRPNAKGKKAIPLFKLKPAVKEPQKRYFSSAIGAYLRSKEFKKLIDVSTKYTAEYALAELLKKFKAEYKPSNLVDNAV